MHFAHLLGRVCVVIAVAWLSLMPRDAHADVAPGRAHLEEAAHDPDDRTAADALYQLGQMDDLALDFPGAVTHYDASAKRLPSGRYAPRAIRRASELRGHAEGGFAPLVELERVRRSATLSSDAVAIDSLVKDAASFPPGKVRVDARILAAEAYAGRLGRKDEALPLLQLVAADPMAETLTARAAAAELLQAYIAKKDFAHALAVTDAYPRLLEPTARRDLVRVIRRRPLRIAAWVDLGVLFAFALFSFARPGRARVLHATFELAPMALLFALLASGVGGLLASRYEQTSPYPFTAMLPAMFVISLLARAWSAAGSPRREARALRAVVSFVGVLAAAFLLLDRMDPAYLAGFGL